MKKMSAIRLWAISLLSMLCFGWSWAQDTYVKVTSEDQLEAGAKYLIVCTAKGKAMAGQTNSKYRGVCDVTISDDEISTEVATSSSDNLPFEFTLNESNGKWTFFDEVNQKYLAHGGSSTLDMDDNTFEWSILLYSSNGQNPNGNPVTVGDIEITSTSDQTRFIRFNKDRFACYTHSSTSQPYVQIYKKQDPASVCEAPTSLTAKSGVASVELSWTAPANDPANGYNITLTPAAGGDAINKTTEAGVTTLTVNDLAEETEYNWTVASNCGDENTSEAVSGAAFTTLAADKPGVSTTTTSVDKSIMIDGSTTETINFTSADITSNLAISIKSKDGQGTAGYTTETSEITSDAAASFSITVNSAASLAAGVYQDTLVISHDGAALCKVVLNLEVSKYKTPKAVITPNGGTFIGKAVVSLTSSLHKAQIRYTTNGDTPNSESTLYSEAFEINSDCTVKALVFPGSTNEATYETSNDSIAVAEFSFIDITPTSLPLTFNGEKSDISSTEGLYDGNIGTKNYIGNANLQFDKTNAFLLAAFNEEPGSLTYYINNNDIDGDFVFDVESSTDGSTWNNLKKYNSSNPVPSGSPEERIETLPQGTRFVRWIYTQKADGNVGVGTITIYKKITDPIVNVSPASITLASEEGLATTSKATVTGQNLTETLNVSIVKGGEEFSVNPESLEAAAVMADGGAEITITYTPADGGKDTAMVVVAHGDVKDTLSVYGAATAVETVNNIKALYNDYANVDGNKLYKVTGNVVITNKDSYKSRVWLQDENMEDGASILLFGDNVEFGYDQLNIGDVIAGISGKLNKNDNGILEFIPEAKTLTASATGKDLHVDTLTINELQSSTTEYLSALVCIKNLTFEDGDGNNEFDTYKSYYMSDGEEKIALYTNFFKADYIGALIPTTKSDVTGVVSMYRNNKQITARSSADITDSPCELVSNITTSVTATTADINFEGSAAQYAYRYGSVKAELESADVDTVKEKHIAITDLTAETKYFFQIKSLCSATNESEWTAVDSFTTVSSITPTLNMSVPKVDSIFTGEVSVKYAVNNFELGKEKDGFVKIAFSNGDTVYTDQLEYKKWMKSGKYSVAIELVDTDSASLSSPVMVAARNFSVNLPDVATPVITPDASIVYMDSVKVSISCATEDATILYSVDGNEPSIEYTGEFILKSTATVKAIAFAQNMDTSLIASARFSIRETVEIEGDLVFAEYFDKVTEGSLGQNGQNTEITDKLDANTEIPGWTGSKVYAAGGIIKLGSSSAKGYITTPAINLSNNEGVFYVSFQTMAWKDDPTSILLIAGEDTVTVEGLLNSPSYTENMREFVYKFENGTEGTKLTFAAIANKNRFFLDSIEVYQVLPEVPMFVGVPTSMEMETIKGTPVSKEVSIKGRLLSENVSLASSSKNITLSASELKKEDVMAENGATLKVTFNAEVLADTATVTLVSGELKDTIMVYASAEDFIEVANLAELRKGEQGKLYKVKSEVVLTAMDSYRNYKFIQDSTAGMLIDDANGLVTTKYEIGNGITGVYGRLASFSNQLQLAMIGNLPEASSEKVAIDTIEVSIAELNGNMEKYCSRLVRINGLSMTIDTVKEWASNKDHYAADGEDTINIHTFIRNGNFVGDTIPAEFDLVGIAGIFKTSAQVSPRFKTDIIVKEGEGGDTGVYNQWMVADINTNLYPNPSNGEFTVEMDQDAQVEIFNAMGVRVQAMNLTAGKHAVRINQSGVYFVRFSNGKASSVKRVIIR